MARATNEPPIMGGPSIVGFGKYSQGKEYVYIKRLDDIDLDELEHMVAAAYKATNS